MKHIISALSLAAGIAALAGCAVGPVSVGEKSSPMYAAGSAYDAYYDNYYGPIYDGYWSDSGFNFRTAADQQYQQDTAGHFRRQATPGFQQIHGEVHPQAPGAPR
jgi:hypothetical protein